MYFFVYMCVYSIWDNTRIHKKNRPVCVLFQILFVPLPHENLKLQGTKEDDSAVDKENRYYAYSTNGC